MSILLYSLIIYIENIIIWKAIQSGKSKRYYKEENSTILLTIWWNGLVILANKLPGNLLSTCLTAKMQSNNSNLLSKLSKEKKKDPRVRRDWLVEVKSIHKSFNYHNRQVLITNRGKCLKTKINLWKFKQINKMKHWLRLLIQESKSWFKNKNNSRNLLKNLTLANLISANVSSRIKASKKYLLFRLAF